jgi:tetratricopeptide (TPR) repeat protein
VDGRPGAPGHDEHRPPPPEIPATVTADQLDRETRAELNTLPPHLADMVARWLVAASLEEEPDKAYEYACQARQLAARVGAVRETCGVAAYRSGRWAEALAELRTARRLTGRTSYLPLMADSERALGRADRALAIINDPGVAKLDRATQVELRIVESGIRRDEGRPAAGAVALQVPELTDGRRRAWSARLYYAYADALLDAGREEEAREWFGRAAAVDETGETDAAERYDGLDGVLIEDLAEPEDGEEDLAGPGENLPGQDDQDYLEPGEEDHPGEEGLAGPDEREPAGAGAEVPGELAAGDRADASGDTRHGQEDGPPGVREPAPSGPTGQEDGPPGVRKPAPSGPTGQGQ